MKKIILILVIVLTTIVVLANNPVWETCLEGEDIQDLKQSHNMIYGVTKNQFFKSNNGLNFEIINVSSGDNPESETLVSVSMVNQSIGYIVGYNQPPGSYREPIIYKTTNSGISWQECNGPFANIDHIQEIEVSFINQTEGYLVIRDITDLSSPYFIIYRTVDAGNNWEMVWSIPTTSAEDYYYSDFNSYPKILVSSHRSFISLDGLNWQLVNLPSNTLRTSLASNNGRLILFNSNGNENKFYYSNNLGLTWQAGNSPELINDSYYLAANNSWLAAQNNHLVAVLTFNRYSSEPPEHNYCRALVSHNNGGSWQWSNILMHVVRNVHKIYYWEEYFYFFLTKHDGDKYVRRIHVGPPVSNNDLVIPLTKIEANCFPNPFRKKTKLSLDLKQTNGELTTVSIYNLKGQLVCHLLDSYLNSGQHEIDWNGQDGQGNLVSPGMYFFKIKSGKFSATKKVVLIK